MHTVSVRSRSLPSVACYPSDTTKVEQLKIICNMFVNTALRQCSTITQVVIRR